MNTQEHIHNVKEICDKLIEDYSPPKKEKAIMSYQRFNEYLLRLEYRYNELANFEIRSFQSNSKNLHDTQLIFLDKTESFHQHVYATISSFISLLTNLNNQKSSYPISSVTKFLRYMFDNSYDSVLKDQISILQKSTDFRSKFIDHTQQHALHDWMTYTYIDLHCIIYFIRQGNNVVLRSVFDPYDKDFLPPVDHKSFYVSPNSKITYDALLYFSKKVLTSLLSSDK